MQFKCSEIQTVLVSVVIEAESAEEALQKFYDGDYEQSAMTEQCLDSSDTKAVAYVAEPIQIFIAGSKD